MPLKKGVNKTLKSSNPEKLLSRPKNKIKLPCDTSVSRVSIHKRKNSGSEIENETASPKKLCRKVHTAKTLSKNDIKYNLANGVAAQLQKSPLFDKILKEVSRVKSPKQSNKASSSNLSDTATPKKCVQSHQLKCKKVVTTRKFNGNQIPQDDLNIRINNSTQGDPKVLNKSTNKRIQNGQTQKKKKKMLEENVTLQLQITKDDGKRRTKKPMPIKRSLSFRHKSELIPVPKPRPNSGKLFQALNNNKNSEDCLNLTPQVRGYAKSSNTNRIVSRNSILKNPLTNESVLSWTKKMSSSSTTCVKVSSNDFVLIDNKFPVLKLTHVDCKVNVATESENDHDLCLVKDSQMNNVSLPNNKMPLATNVTSSSLNFSNVTVHSGNHNEDSISCKVEIKSKLTDLINQISSNLKATNVEAINWIGCTNRYTQSQAYNFRKIIMQKNILFEERAIIDELQDINKLLNKYEENDTHDKADTIPSTELDLYNVDNFAATGHEPNEKLQQINNVCELDNEMCVASKELHNCSENSPQYCANKLVDDDDDALSLFAESIIDTDTSRRNISISQNVEEYIPQSMSNNPFKLPTLYQPSKISVREETKEKELNTKKINVCEKQNADSTSVNKDLDSDDTRQENILLDDDTVDTFADKKIIISNMSDTVRNRQCLMASLFGPISGIKSYVFKGVCFFNLINSCKKAVCKFPHEFVKENEVQNRLRDLDEDNFIKEYMLLRMWPILWRTYILLYIEECINRKLTRMLLEMSIDSIIKPKDACQRDNVLKLSIVEYTLLYLNKFDVYTCADLLKYVIDAINDIQLCDFFMTTMAKSQNFSRFRKIFVNLTDFMCENNRYFSLEVSTNLLERMCILPYDESLARCVVEIIKRTDTQIFFNNMMDKFEMMLSCVPNGLYERFLMVKTATGRSNTTIDYRLLSKPYLRSDMGSVGHTPVDKHMRYSPDTTHMDVLSKPLEPKFNRIINLKKLKKYADVNRISPPANTESNDRRKVHHQLSSTNHSAWKGKSIFQKIFQLNNPQNIRGHQYDNHLT